jgi:HAD superfamily hydrolase (TIGR01509 family)
MRFDAVLIELEGVLADTAARRRHALRRSLAHDAVPLSDEDFAACCAGLPPREAAAAAARRAGATLDDTALDLAALRAERHFAEGDGATTLVPGARELVEALAASTRVGIVTRLSRQEVEPLLGLAELEYAAEVVVGAEDAPAAKPDPAPYRVALARLSRRRPVSPDAVLALEDGAPGIAAATAAGLACIVVGALPAHEAMRAAGVLPSLVGVTPARLWQVAGAPAREAR